MNTAKSIQPNIIPSPLVRPLRAVAKGGQADHNLLAARAADEIERMAERIADLEDQLARYAKPKADSQ